MYEEILSWEEGNRLLVHVSLEAGCLLGQREHVREAKSNAGTDISDRSK